MSNEHVRQRINDRIAFYKAEIKKANRKITQFNAYESPVDTYRGAIKGLKEALDFLDEERFESLYRHACMQCKYALVDTGELRLRCSKDASKHPYDYCPDTPCKSFDPLYVFDMRDAQKISVRKKGGEE